jgi:hypothetical protein
MDQWIDLRQNLLETVDSQGFSHEKTGAKPVNSPLNQSIEMMRI